MTTTPPKYAPIEGVPQLTYLFKQATPSQIQHLIDTAPTRDAQIKRWFEAYTVTGKEFNLPVLVSSGTIAG